MADIVNVLLPLASMVLGCALGWRARGRRARAELAAHRATWHQYRDDVASRAFQAGVSTGRSLTQTTFRLDAGGS